MGKVQPAQNFKNRNWTVITQDLEDGKVSLSHDDVEIVLLQNIRDLLIEMQHSFNSLESEVRRVRSKIPAKRRKPPSKKKWGNLQKEGNV